MVHRKGARNYLSVLLVGGALVACGVVLSQTSLAQQEGRPRVDWSAGEKKTMEGVISDITCGAGKHKMADANACANKCAAAKDGRYALVVGETVYEIHGLPTHPAAAAAVGKLAGGKAKVSGTVVGNKINVDTVEAAS